MDNTQRSAGVTVLMGLTTVIIVGCIVGMVACGVTHHVGGVVAFGSVSTGAVAVVFTVSMTQPSRSMGKTRTAQDTGALQTKVEHLVSSLVSTGSDEQVLRELVSESVALGQKM